MSELLLERLSKKKPFQKLKRQEIILEKGQVDAAEDLLVDKTDVKYNIKAFRAELLKKRGLSAPKIFQPIPQIKTTLQTPAASKEQQVETQDNEEPVKKLKKTMKLPGEKIKRKKRQKEEIEDVVLEVPASLIQIEDRPIGDRLQSKEPSVNIKAPAYYLNNREYFINFINSIFKDYGDILKSEEKEELTCDSLKKSKSKSFSLMIHQQIVRDYINLYTPYRGLLLFHGLGAGKTCASIGIAEGIKNENQVIIMTPASLRMNYVSELKHCGDSIYKTNQYWEKIYINGNIHLEKALSEILNIPVAYIRKKGWVWMVDIKKKSNYDSFSPEDQKSIDSQINEMILKKYKFLNYNGMRHSHLDELIRLESGTNEIEQDTDENDDEGKGGESKKKSTINNSVNPFDNKVIIIDEAHNFVSRIVNKLTRNSKKKTPLAIRLYNFILSAKNCRVVFLTGTPIINYPHEIAVLFNMLRGYIKTYYFKLDTSSSGKKINSKFILDIFKKNKLTDYIEYSASKTTLIITRNPFGFINKNKRQNNNIVYAGVSGDERGLKSDNDFERSVQRILNKNGINVIRAQSKIENHKVLPDSLENFRNMFINSENGKMKEVNIFKKRILGLTSYFRSASEALLPKYNNIPKVFHINMSNYQLGIYERARAAERKEEKRNAKKKLKQKNQQGIYAETTSTYRIFSRAFCNFVFPNELVKDSTGREHLLIRPMPKVENTLEDTISTKVSIKEKKAGVTKTSADEDIMDGIEAEEKVQNIDGLYSQEDIIDIEKKQSEQVDVSYKGRIKKAIELLKFHGDKYLSVTGLKEYGPKFLQMLKNIQNEEHIGLHLIYSQFRTLEGVGIFAEILEYNGFSRFKISRKSGSWKIDMTEEERQKKSFALYTGTETAEEKEIIRNIFNGTWDSIPSTLATELRQISNNNNLGEIIKVLMITSSGSEGITLRNTRYVHLVEPYWHPVRTDQVIGRARRICSHQALPLDLRTVDVFVYLMTFTQEQIKGNPDAPEKADREPKITINLRNSKADKSKIDRKTIFTSDETLYEISNIKKTTNDSILKAIKESSIDCVLHSKSNKNEGLVCYSFGSPSVNSYSFKPNFSTEEKDSVESQNIKKVTWSAKKIKISGVTYALKNTDESNPNVGEVYDLDSYNSGVAVLVGRTRMNPKKPGFLQFLHITSKNF